MAREGLRRRAAAPTPVKAGPAKKKARQATTKTPASPSKDEEQCSICMEELDSLRILVIRPCDHQFHRTCAIDWLESRKSVRDQTCPNCRNPVEQITVDDRTDENRVLAFGGGKQPTRSKVLELMRHQRLKGHEQRIVDKDEWLAKLKRANEEDLALVRGHRTDAVQKRKLAVWVDDIDKELQKLDQRTRAYNEINLADGRPARTPEETRRRLARVLGQPSDVDDASLMILEGHPARQLLHRHLVEMSSSSSSSLSSSSSDSDDDDDSLFPESEFARRMRESRARYELAEDRLADGSSGAINEQLAELDEMRRLIDEERSRIELGMPPVRSIPRPRGSQRSQSVPLADDPPTAGRATTSRDSEPSASP